MAAASTSPSIASPSCARTSSGASSRCFPCSPRNGITICVIGQTLDVTNAALAERLDAFAALLDLNGSGHYTVRAYRRAADLIRATPADVAALVRAGRARELAGIGPGIEARLRELVETGRIAELDELEAQALPELVGVAALLGVSTKRMRELGHALGIRTLPELRAAAAEGRLASVPGIGPKTAARIEQGLAELSTARPRRGMTLNRALALVGECGRGSRRRAGRRSAARVRALGALRRRRAK